VTGTTGGCREELNEYSAGKGRKRRTNHGEDDQTEEPVAGECQYAAEGVGGRSDIHPNYGNGVANVASAITHVKASVRNEPSLRAQVDEDGDSVAKLRPDNSDAEEGVNGCGRTKGDKGEGDLCDG
jgi:hypothetical protein